MKRKFIIIILVFLWSNALSTITLIEPDYYGYEYPASYLGVWTLGDGIPRSISFINNRKATSNIMQPFIFYAINEPLPESLIFHLFEYDRAMDYPDSHQISIRGLYYGLLSCDSVSSAASLYKLVLKYETLLDTLSDTSWLFAIVPMGTESLSYYTYFPRIVYQNTSDSCIFRGPFETVPAEINYYYEGPCLLSFTEDTLSKGLSAGVGGFQMASRCPSDPIFLLAVAGFFAIDYSGPIASNPNPGHHTIIEDLHPIIKITILDTFTYDPLVRIPGHLSCPCFSPSCVDSAGSYLLPLIVSRLLPYSALLILPQF